MPEKKPYHHGDLERVLVDVAIGLLAEKGAEGLTIAEAARRAGVSHTAVYRHYRDKRALLASVAERGFERLRDAMARAGSETETLSPRDGFLRTGRAVVRFAVDEPVLYRTMFSGVKASPMRALAKAPEDSAFGMLLELVRAMQGAGVVREGDPLAHALAIWSTTHGLAMLAAAGEVPSAPKALARLADSVHSTLIDGLAPRS